MEPKHGRVLTKMFTHVSNGASAKQSKMTLHIVCCGISNCWYCLCRKKETLGVFFCWEKSGRTTFSTNTSNIKRQDFRGRVFFGNRIFENVRWRLMVNDFGQDQ